MVSQATQRQALKGQVWAAWGGDVGEVGLGADASADLHIRETSVPSRLTAVFRGPRPQDRCRQGDRSVISWIEGLQYFRTRRPPVHRWSHKCRPCSPRMGLSQRLPCACEVRFRPLAVLQPSAFKDSYDSVRSHALIDAERQCHPLPSFVAAKTSPSLAAGDSMSRRSRTSAIRCSAWHLEPRYQPSGMSVLMRRTKETKAR
jgi:hypothetical protein